MTLLFIRLFFLLLSGIVGYQIGAIGSTGLVTGPHLHWEVIIRGVEIDGQLWLNAGEIIP